MVDEMECFNISMKSDRESRESRFPFFQREKLGTLGRVPEMFFPHIPPIFGLYNGCIGQYGVIFWEQLLGYPSKGTKCVPLIFSRLAKTGQTKSVEELALAPSWREGKYNKPQTSVNKVVELGKSMITTCSAEVLESS